MKTATRDEICNKLSFDVDREWFLKTNPKFVLLEEIGGYYRPRILATDLTTFELRCEMLEDGRRHFEKFCVIP